MTTQRKEISTAEFANTCEIQYEPFKHHEGDRLNSYRVVIAGEARAMLIPKSYRRGYVLKDSQGRPIRRAYHVKHYSFIQGEEVETRKDFDFLIRTCLYESAIDTVEQQLETTGRLAREDSELKQRCENECGLAHVQSFAQPLFEMLAGLIQAAEESNATRTDLEAANRTAVIESARALYFRVHEAQAKGINAERESRQRYLMAGGRNV